MNDLDTFISGLYATGSHVKTSGLDGFGVADLGRIYGTPASHLEAAEKLAHDAACFLEQFEGTPLHAQAIALVGEELRIEAERIQRDEARRAQQEPMDDSWSKQRMIDLKKRQLELELHKMKAEHEGAEGQEQEAQEHAEGVPAPQTTGAVPTKTASALAAAAKNARPSRYAVPRGAAGNITSGFMPPTKSPLRTVSGPDVAAVRTARAKLPGHAAVPQNLDPRRLTPDPETSRTAVEAALPGHVSSPGPLNASQLRFTAHNHQLVPTGARMLGPDSRMRTAMRITGSPEYVSYRRSSDVANPGLASARASSPRKPLSSAEMMKVLEERAVPGRPVKTAALKLAAPIDVARGLLAGAKKPESWRNAAQYMSPRDLLAKAVQGSKAQSGGMSRSVADYLTKKAALEKVAVGPAWIGKHVSNFAMKGPGLASDRMKRLATSAANNEHRAKLLRGAHDSIESGSIFSPETALRLRLWGAAKNRNFLAEQASTAGSALKSVAERESKMDPYAKARDVMHSVHKIRAPAPAPAPAAPATLMQRLFG